MVPRASPARSLVLDRVVERVLGSGAGRVRVGVDGRTASGKSSFARELADRIARTGGREVLLASLDDFNRPWRDRRLYDRESGEGYYRNVLDHQAVRRLLLDPVAPGGSGICALCSLDPRTQSDHSAVTVTAAPDAVVVVEGVFAFRPELDGCWDLRVWLEIPAELAVHRGVGRDAVRVGDEVERLHRDRYLPGEELYLAEVDPVGRADVVIDNTSFEAPVVRSP